MGEYEREGESSAEPVNIEGQGYVRGGGKEKGRERKGKETVVER